MLELNILINKGRNKSGSSCLNYYSIEGNVHVMDNHLGAIKSLYEIGDKSEEIVFYHIDRHYDLGGLTEEHNTYIQGDKEIPEIEDLDSIKSIWNCNIFLWDNYIHLFYGKYHQKIKETYFSTHQTTQRLWDWEEFKEITPFKLINYHPHEKGAILNIDIDYFYYETKDGEIYEAYSHDFLESFKNWFSENKNKFELIIIALSPECCGGWSEAIKMFETLFPQLMHKL